VVTWPAYGTRCPGGMSNFISSSLRRRNKVGSTYLPAVNPIVEPALDATGRLTFVNAAVAAGVAPPPSGGYSARWFTYDNATGATAAIGTPTVGRDPEVRAPGALPASGYLKIEISGVQPPHASWAVPIDVYFHRTPAGWTLVGLDRLPPLESVAPLPAK